MKRLHILACLLACTLPLSLFAQKAIEGTVIDAATSDPLPAATIAILGSNTGTIANAAGGFTLFVPTLPQTIVIRHIGYASDTLQVTERTPGSLTIALTPVAYTLEEVTITGEDPAIAIMRQVLQKKQTMRQGQTGSYAEVYTRFMLYRELDLVQMTELVNASYWREDGGAREIIRAKRYTPRNSGHFKFATPQYVPNLYDDTISLLGFVLIGPTHPDALEVYTFTLGGHRMIDDQVVFDIYFAPKNGSSATLIGHVSVLDEDFTLFSVGARPHPDNVLPAPVESWSISLEQQFAEMGAGYWMPQDLKITGSVQFGRSGVHYPVARYEQVSRLTHYAVGIQPPDSLFQDERTTFEMPFAENRHDLFRRNDGIVPLTPHEMEALHALPSTMHIARAFRPSGLLRGYAAIDIEERPDATQEGEQQGRRERLNEKTWLWYNRVDGWHLGLKWPIDLHPDLTVNPAIGYDWELKRLAYAPSLSYRWFDREQVDAYFDASWSRQTATTYTSALYSRLLMGMASYIGYQDYYDYYEKEGYSLSLRAESPLWQSRVSVGFTQENQLNTRKNTGFEGWFFGEEERLNPTITPGRLRALTASVTVGNPDRVRVGLQAEHTEPGLFDSDFAYTLLQGEVSLQLKTFGRKRAWPNRLRIRGIGSVDRGAVPLQRYVSLDAAVGPYSAFGGFKTLQGLPYQGQRHAGLFIEHDFATLLFEKMHLWGLVDRGVGFILHGAMGKTEVDISQLRPENEGLIKQGILHKEVGISFTHFFNYPFRLDITRRVDDPSWSITIGLYHQ